MTTKPNPIPPGYHTITPYYLVDDSRKFLEFIQKAFGAEVKCSTTLEDGQIAHAEVKIGNSMLMMSQARGPFPARQMTVYLYVEDCDALWRSAVAAGGKSIMEPADQFYGDRNAGVEDPFGNTWWIGTHVEDVSPDELARRAREQGRG